LDGKGGIYSAEINDDNPKRCRLEILSVSIEPPSDYEIHIAIAPTKNMDRIEWFVEKATELGITRISFVKCDRSERKVLNLERIEKIVVAAMKQSKRTYLPTIEPLVTFSSFIEKHKDGALAHCETDAKEPLVAHLRPVNFPVLIGPEGDFSKEEIFLAKENGYQFITLGKTRLRTETAGLYAVTLLKNALE
jgi:16S rRNA (uracil1498-N3)-methyltransferase